MSARICVKNLSYKIPYGDCILEDLNFTIEEGDFYGVLGKNGAGKTTLIDLLLGNRPITSGELKVLGEDPIQVERSNQEKIVFLSQEVSLKGNITISQFLNFHSSLYSSYNKEEERRVAQYLQLDLKQKIGALSTGQQKKVQIVGGLASMPDLIIIDEITAVLDPETRASFFKLISEHKNNHGASILLATNIAEDLVERADKVLFLEDRNAKEYSPDRIHELFHLDVAV